MNEHMLSKKISDFLTTDDLTHLKQFSPQTREEFLKHMQAVYNLKLSTPFPLIVHIEPTNICNQHCIMCQHPAMRRKPMNIDPALMKKAIDECIIVGKAWFLHFFFFGEPFLNQRTLEYMKYAKERGLNNISLTSNFTTVTDQDLKNLVDYGVESVVISFEGLNRQSYLNIRQTDHFEIVKENIERLLSYRKQKKRDRPWITLTYVRTTESDEEIAAFQKEWELKVNAIHVSPQFHYLGRSRLAASGTYVNSQNILERDEVRRLPCRQLWLRIAVLSNGEIVPCSQNMDGELSLGNIAEMTIQEAWTGEKMAHLRMQHMSNRFDSSCVCRTCIDWDWSGKVDKRPEIK